MLAITPALPVQARPMCRTSSVGFRTLSATLEKCSEGRRVYSVDSGNSPRASDGVAQQEQRVFCKLWRKPVQLRSPLSTSVRTRDVTSVRQFRRRRALAWFSTAVLVNWAVRTHLRHGEATEAALPFTLNSTPLHDKSVS